MQEWLIVWASRPGHRIRGCDGLALAAQKGGSAGNPAGRGRGTQSTDHIGPAGAQRADARAPTGAALRSMCAPERSAWTARVRAGCECPVGGRGASRAIDQLLPRQQRGAERTGVRSARPAPRRRPGGRARDRLLDSRERLARLLHPARSGETCGAAGARQCARAGARLVGAQSDLSEDPRRFRRAPHRQGRAVGARRGTEHRSRPRSPNRFARCWKC